MTKQFIGSVDEMDFQQSAPALNPPVILKTEGSVVFPQYGVSRYVGAGSRGVYGLASIVDALYEAVWVASHRRKSSDFAFFP